VPAGRPSNYTQDTIMAAWQYALGGWSEAGDRVPSVAGLACEIGVHRETCYAWGRDPKKSEFSDILKKIAETQERVLLNNGLGGVFNAPITKMMLSKHGYADSIDNKSSDGTMTPKPALDVSKLSDAALAEIAALDDGNESD